MAIAAIVLVGRGHHVDGHRDIGTIRRWWIGCGGGSRNGHGRSSAGMAHEIHLLRRVGCPEIHGEDKEAAIDIARG